MTLESQACGFTSFILAVYAGVELCRTGLVWRAGTRRLRARQPHSIRHSLAFRAPPERRAGGRSAGSGFACRARRLELRQGSFLEGEVGVQVRLRRLDRFMTEPQRDHRTVDAGLQQFHRSAVPQHVRRHALGLQRRATLVSDTNMLSQRAGRVRAG